MKEKPTIYAEEFFNSHCPYDNYNPETPNCHFMTAVSGFFEVMENDIGFKKASRKKWEKIKKVHETIDTLYRTFRSYMCNHHKLYEEMKISKKTIRYFDFMDQLYHIYIGNLTPFISNETIQKGVDLIIKEVDNLPEIVRKTPKQ